MGFHFRSKEFLGNDNFDLQCSEKIIDESGTQFVNMYHVSVPALRQNRLNHYEAIMIRMICNVLEYLTYQCYLRGFIIEEKKIEGFLSLMEKRSRTPGACSGNSRRHGRIPSRCKIISARKSRISISILQPRSLPSSIALSQGLTALESDVFGFEKKNSRKFRFVGSLR